VSAKAGERGANHWEEASNGGMGQREEDMQ
jgi:hypothetical protein